MLPSNQKNEKEYFWNGGYEIVVYCLTIHLEPEPFYFWKVGARASKNRAGPKLCLQHMKYTIYIIHKWKVKNL